MPKWDRKIFFWCINMLLLFPSSNLDLSHLPREAVCIVLRTATQGGCAGCPAPARQELLSRFSSAVAMALPQCKWDQKLAPCHCVWVLWELNWITLVVICLGFFFPNKCDNSTAHCSESSPWERGDVDRLLKGKTEGTKTNQRTKQSLNLDTVAQGVFSVLSSSVACLITTVITWLSRGLGGRRSKTDSPDLPQRFWVDQGKWLNLLMLVLPFHKPEVAVCNFCILAFQVALMRPGVALQQPSIRSIWGKNLSDF